MEPNGWHLAKVCAWKVCSLESTTFWCNWFQQKSTPLLNVCIVLPFGFLWLWFPYLGSHCAFLWSSKKPFNNCYFLTIQEPWTIWMPYIFCLLVFLSKVRRGKADKQFWLQSNYILFALFGFLFFFFKLFRLNGNVLIFKFVVPTWKNFQWLSTLAKGVHSEAPAQNDPQNPEGSSVKSMLIVYLIQSTYFARMVP